ncbi:hypothetical protein AAC387_Pa07g3167 [Persea americana]
MGGIIDGGAGLDSKTSPHRVAIEKAQAELRQEFDVREERRRELEFLERGGNPLDFKVGPATSISVQSTSVTDQHTEHEAKGSFALTASPHGDSVDSSARPLGKEPTTADNLLLFDVERDAVYGDRNAACLSRRGDTTLSEQSCRRGRSHSVKESEDSAIFRLGVRSQAYARRNRSRSTRDNAHACSTNFAPSGHNNRSSMVPSSRHNSRDVKSSLSEKHLDKDRTIPSICNSKTSSPNSNVVSRIVLSDSKMDMDRGADQGHDSMVDPTKAGLAGKSEIKQSEINEHSQIALEQDPNVLSLPPVLVGEGEHGTSAGSHCVPCASTEKKGNSTTAVQINGFSSNMDENSLKNGCQNNRNGSSDTFVAVVGAKGLDSKFFCNQINGSLDENIASNRCTISRKVNNSSNGNAKEQTEVLDTTPSMPDVGAVEEKNESISIDVQATASGTLTPVPKNLSNSNVQVKTEEEFCNSRSVLQNEAEPITNIEGMKLIQLGDNSDSKRPSVCPEPGTSCTSVSLNCEPLEANFPVKSSTADMELENSMENRLLLANKEHEDVILEKARTIEARRKRSAELSLSNAPSEKRRKSHWDFVLEEMAWLANDFMQERVWKTTAAAQISHCISFSGRLKFNHENLCRKQRKVAHTLAKAILQFWNSVELSQDRDDPSNDSDEHNSSLFVSGKAKSVESIKDKIEEPIVAQESNRDMEENNFKQRLQLPIKKYALRFLSYSKSADCSVQAEAPMTPDRISDARILQLSCEDRYSEESLLYTVPSGAMEEYRKSVESHWAQNERTGNKVHQEEFETSFFDSIPDFGARECANEEDEGETGFYYLPGTFEGRKPSKFTQRTTKGLQKSYPTRSYEIGSDLPYGHFLESKLGSQPSPSTGKRSSSSLVGPIPTKRVRTPARQRIGGPLGAGVAGGGQVATKTDASSGDTSSFHDDQTSVHGGSQPRKVLEVESTGDCVKQLPFDKTDISLKPKKKKAKQYRNTLSSNDSAGFACSVKGSSFEPRWQLDSIAQHEQRDHSRKRVENHQLESNGNTGMHGQHAAKKPKVLKQLPDASLEPMNPVSGSIPSPVASQMSNMSNPNKLIKFIANRDRGRKAKAVKIPTGQSGSGSPWSVYEDQALVVLVHDMGPNWELISDAINSTLQFKCIFRKPKECKERHKELMDRNAGDGADSAEDSGSSQPYPSTLPGIPKGSARQLFQRLQGPMEEDTLKAHFEKIIHLGRHLHSRRSQKADQEMKPSTSTVHSSHHLTFSHACPANLNGGFLTPLDLCDAATSSLDGYQGSHGGVAVTSHQGSVATALSASSANSMLQGSSGMVIGSSLPSPSAAINGPARDMQRYGMQRPSSLPVDEQQRMQHYSQMISNRSNQHSSAAVSGALSVGADRGVRMPPAANGMGMTCGINRGMPMPRPGFQGMGSPSMTSMVPPGNMLPSNGVGMPSPANMHNGAVSGQGNPMLRPREAMQRLTPGQNPEQMQMMMQELQMQVTQGNGSGVIPYNGLSTAFPNQTGPPPVQTFPVQHQQQQMPQQSHVLTNPLQLRLQGTNHNPHQQPIVIHMAKERIQQQRMQQQQFAARNSPLPHSQLQMQHPMSPVSNNSHIQQQSSAQSVPLPPPNSQHPLTPPMNPATLQAQQKQHHGPQGLSRIPQTGGALPNQMLKQRPRQQPQQQPRHHPQQRQQSQQQAKLMKGVGRGSMLLHQNLPVDAPHVNGLSPAAGIQVAEKGEQPVMHLMQGEGLFPGSGRNPVSLGKQMGPQAPNQVQQQKMFPRSVQPSSNQQSQTPPHLDSNSQGQVQVPPGHPLSAPQQPVSSSSLIMASQQQQKVHRQTSQPQQAVQRVLQKNHKTSSNAPIQTPADQADANSLLFNNTFQMGSSTITQCTVPNNAPAVSCAASPPSQWKESSYDTKNVSPPGHLSSMGNSHQSNASGTESMPSSSQRLVSQGHFSGSVLIHGHGVGGQRQQQLHQQQQQQPQQQQQGQGQGGSLHPQPSVSGPG